MLNSTISALPCLKRERLDGYKTTIGVLIAMMSTESLPFNFKIGSVPRLLI